MITGIKKLLGLSSIFMPAFTYCMLIKLPQKEQFIEAMFAVGMSKHFIECSNSTIVKLANRELPGESIIVGIHDAGQAYLNHMQQLQVRHQHIQLSELEEKQKYTEIALARKLLERYPDEIARLEKEGLLN